MMDFGSALEAVKQEFLVLRVGWPKGQFIYLKDGSTSIIPIIRGLLGHIDGISSNLFQQGEEGTTTRLPCICMKLPSGSLIEGWIPNQQEMLAEDWKIYTIK
jgi:hypothetical protein